MRAHAWDPSRGAAGPPQRAHDELHEREELRPPLRVVRHRARLEVGPAERASTHEYPSGGLTWHNATEAHDGRGAGRPRVPSVGRTRARMEPAGRRGGRTRRTPGVRLEPPLPAAVPRRCVLCAPRARRHVGLRWQPHPRRLRPPARTSASACRPTSRRRAGPARCRKVCPSAAGLGSPLPRLRRDWAHRPLLRQATGRLHRREHRHRAAESSIHAMPCGGGSVRHICTGTGLTPCHICAGTGLAPATSAPGPGSAPATSAPGLSAPWMARIILEVNSAVRPRLQPTHLLSRCMARRHVVRQVSICRSLMRRAPWRPIHQPLPLDMTHVRVFTYAHGLTHVHSSAHGACARARASARKCARAWSKQGGTAHACARTRRRPHLPPRR